MRRNTSPKHRRCHHRGGWWMLSDWLLLAVVVALIVVVVAVAAGDTEDITLAGRKCHNNNTASSGQVLPHPKKKDEDLAKLPATTHPLATVYDRVLSSETAEWVHGLCVAWNEESKKHKAQIAAANNSNEAATAAATTTDVAVDPADLIFEFPLEHPERHRPLQRFLNDLVWQMILLEGRNDEKGAFDTTTVPRYYVEYWTRQQWQHILAHQDMDEGWERRLQKERHECQEQRRRAAANKSGGTPSDENEEDCDTRSSDSGFRHPVTGQVLFLKIGPEVRGPTVVFDVVKGSDLVAPNRASKTNGDNTTTATASTTKTTKTITMASVPTLEGRLLRFRGDRLHAVPRPYDVYWTFDQSRNHIHTPKTQRSVLLFNLWKHDDNDSSSMPLGKVLDCGDGRFPRDRTTCFEKWKIDGSSENVPSSDVSHHPMCRRKKDWERVSFVEMPSTRRDPDPQEASSWMELFWEWLAGGTQQQEFFQVPLLGDAHKRGMAEFVARMQSPRWYDSSGAWIHPTRDGLGEAIRPTLLEIEADERMIHAEQS